MQIFHEKALSSSEFKLASSWVAKADDGVASTRTKGNWNEPLRSLKRKAELSPVAFSDGPDRRRGRAFVWPVVEGPAGLAGECVYLSETVDFLAGETAWTV